MKKIIQLILLVPSLAAAQECPTTNPLMKTYNEQQSWSYYIEKAGDSDAEVAGYVDSGDRFHIDTLKPGNPFATMSIDAKNENYNSFFSLCKDFPTMAKHLDVDRIGKRNNRYNARIRYLPILTAFNNRPYEDLKTGSYTLEVTYASNSLIENAGDSKNVKKEIYQKINSQLDLKGEVGYYDLDLTNLDDFACDLIHGTAKISIFRRMHSAAPLVTVTETIGAQDAATLYMNWKDIGVPSLADRMFMAGAHFEQLKQSNELADLTTDIGLKFLRKVMNEAGTAFKKLNATELKCVVEDMQVYDREQRKHLVNVKFRFDKDVILATEAN